MLTSAIEDGIVVSNVLDDGDAQPVQLRQCVRSSFGDVH